MNLDGIKLKFIVWVLRKFVTLYRKIKFKSWMEDKLKQCHIEEEGKPK